MHIRKSRNKIHCSILDIPLNKLNVAAMATKDHHRVVEQDCSSKAKAIRRSLTTE